MQTGVEFFRWHCLVTHGRECDNSVYNDFIFLARFARRLFVALTSEAVFKGDWRVQIPPPGMFKVYVTILRIQQFDFFSVRFARRLFLPLL